MPTAMIGPKFYAWDDNGNPLAFGKVHTYQAGTNKRKATFTGENGETANSNPVILNASGYASIYLAGAYKIVVTDANDVPVWSADPVTDVTQRQSDFINERDAAYLGPKKIRINGDATAFYEIGRAVRVALSTGFQYGFVRSAQYGADFTIIDLNGPVSLDPSVVSAAGGLVTSALFGGFPAEQVADFGFLRQELNENSGAELVRTADGRTVQKRFDELGDDYLTLAAGDQVLDDHNQDTKAHPALTNFLVKLTQDAQTAADVAMFDSNIYETVLLGIANTAPGEFFYVVSEQDDEFVVLYKNVSDSGTGVLRTVAFAGSEATKTLAADAYNSVYNAGFSVEVDGLAPGEPGFLSVVLFGKRSGGSFTQLASETYSSNLDGTTASYPGQSLSGVLLNAGENAVFKLELTTGTTGTLTVGNLTYQEGNPADAADPIKTFPTANAMQAFIQSATNEADRAKTEADRAQAAADAAEATSIAYAVDAAAAQAAIDADVLSVDNAAIFAKALIDGYEQSVETEAINAINAIESLGWLPVGTFAAGFTFTSLLDVGLDNDGNWWSWSGEFPQVVDAGTDPTLNPNFKLRGDGVLRSDLAAPGSDVLIADVEAQQVAFTSDLVRYGASLSQPQFGGLTPTKQNAILKISDTRYRAFVHLGGRTWQVCDLVNSGLDSEGNTTPYGWSKTDVNDYVEPIVWGDAGVTSSGSSFELTSTDSVPYIGHKALQLQAVAAYIEVELTVNQAGANLYLNYTGRTSANIVNVTIDGSTALVNEAATVDTYTPVDLTHRQSVLIASNLPAKSSPYLIRFTVSASKNPSALAGDRFVFNAITLDGGEFGNPWSPRVRPKPWTESTVIAQWEERIGAGGRVYVATVGGTTSTTSPSHTSGTATDGTVTWTFVASSSFVSRTQTATLQAEGSQLEYAYEFRKTGDVTYQDVGGNLHGNEYLTGLRIYVDGALRSAGIGQYIVGNNIQFVQDIYAYYGTLPTVEHLADTVLSHNIGGGRIVVSHQSEFKLSGNFGYNYPAMWPIVYYLSSDARTTFNEMELAQAGRISPDDYASVVNPFVGGTTDLQMTAIGSIYKPVGTQMAPTTDGGAYHAIATLQVTDYGVGSYEFSTRLASMAPNLAGSVTPSGGASWVMKMYFARSNTDKTEPVTVGKVVRSDAEYKLSLFRQ